MTTTQPLSTCCGALIGRYGSSDGINENNGPWYCLKCGNPCDIAVQKEDKKLFKTAYVGGKKYVLNKVGTQVDFSKTPPEVLDDSPHPQTETWDALESLVLKLVDGQTKRTLIIMSSVRSLLLSQRQEILERVKRIKTNTFQPVGGISNIKYVALDDVLEALKKNI